MAAAGDTQLWLRQRIACPRAGGSRLVDSIRNVSGPRNKDAQLPIKIKLMGSRGEGFSRIVSDLAMRSASSLAREDLDEG